MFEPSGPEDSYIGEIRLFAGKSPPKNWLFCEGQLLNVGNYQALAGAIGARWGGDGRTTFGLPDLRGRVPVHQGHGPGLSQRVFAEKGGEDDVVLTAAHVPAHTHALMATAEAATSNVPGPTLIHATATMKAGSAAGLKASAYVDDTRGSTLRTLHRESIGMSGGTLSGVRAHTNVMRSLPVHFIICCVGLFPIRA